MASKTLGPHAWCLLAVLMSALAGPGCVTSPVPVRDAALPLRSGTWRSPDPSGTSDPGATAVIEHASFVSARWKVSRAGLIDLGHPRARAAQLDRRDVPIVLPVHVLRHPRAGLYIVDTGISRARAGGDLEDTGPFMRAFLEGIRPELPLGDILERFDDPVAGVLLTHMHPDHVLGLGDVPPQTPVFTGVGESGARRIGNGAARRSYRAWFGGRPVFELRADAGRVGAQRPSGFPDAVDLFGDASVWALPCPGHTPGSLAYLARTDAGPLLITGDASHTRWGFIHGVPPGTFNDDLDGAASCLERLRAVARDTGATTHVGHESAPIAAGELVH